MSKSFFTLFSSLAIQFAKTNFGARKLQVIEATREMKIKVKRLWFQVSVSFMQCYYSVFLWNYRNMQSSGYRETVRNVSLEIKCDMGCVLRNQM